MTDRLRETDALPFSEPELKGWQMGADSGATATNHNVRRFLATIERQGSALRAVASLADEIEEYEETQKPAEAMDLAALAIVRGIRRALNQMEVNP